MRAACWPLALRHARRPDRALFHGCAWRPRRNKRRQPERGRRTRGVHPAPAACSSRATSAPGLGSAPPHPGLGSPLLNGDWARPSFGGVPTVAVTGGDAFRRRIAQQCTGPHPYPPSLPVLSAAQSPCPRALPPASAKVLTDIRRAVHLPVIPDPAATTRMPGGVSVASSGAPLHAGGVCVLGVAGDGLAVRSATWRRGERAGRNPCGQC